MHACSTLADPGFSFGARSSAEGTSYRGATGAEGVGFGKGCPLPNEGGVWTMGRGLCPSSENFWIFFCLEIVHFACIVTHD